MVRQGDFEISIVLADTKTPFKEHTKDGKVYVEAEPDEEYFIYMERVGNAVNEPLLAVASVDEKCLGYRKTFLPSSIGKPVYAGLRTFEGGTTTRSSQVYGSHA